ncbi:hypothetical protein I552_8788 [Mycobacterium xenopi 3993]|nr:hypothetical protein I552_8788 [Mycobacterium xenopi 3993]
MTNSAAGKPNLGRFGSFGRGVTPEQAKEIEALGYGAVWVGGSPPAELEWVEPILEQTTTLQVATGIVNIWTASADAVAESFHRIDSAYPAASCWASVSATARRTPNIADHMRR